MWRQRFPGWRAMASSTRRGPRRHSQSWVWIRKRPIRPTCNQGAAGRFSGPTGAVSSVGFRLHAGRHPLLRKGDCSLRPHHSHISRQMITTSDKRQQAAFGAGCPSAPQPWAHWMGAQQVAPDDQPAIRGAVEVRFCPIPTGVETKRPPERSCVPKAKAEDDTDAGRPEQPYRGLAGFCAVGKSKQHESSSAPHQNPIPRVRVNCR